MKRRRISPQRWTPPPAPRDSRATGALTITGRLSTGGHGPEDVVFDQEGRVITGLADGSVVAIEPSTNARTELGNTGGRPLGVQPCADGSVLVCDHDRGLLRLSHDGTVEVLADSVDGERLAFASNVV